MKFIEEKRLAVRNRRLAQPRIILGDFSSNHLDELIVQNCKTSSEFLFRKAQKICFIHFCLLKERILIVQRQSVFFCVMNYGRMVMVCLLVNITHFDAPKL